MLVRVQMGLCSCTFVWLTCAGRRQPQSEPWRQGFGANVEVVPSQSNRAALERARSWRSDWPRHKPTSNLTSSHRPQPFTFTCHVCTVLCAAAACSEQKGPQAMLASSTPPKKLASAWLTILSSSRMLVRNGCRVCPGRCAHRTKFERQ